MKPMYFIIILLVLQIINALTVTSLGLRVQDMEDIVEKQTDVIERQQKILERKTGDVELIYK